MWDMSYPYIPESPYPCILVSSYPYTPTSKKNIPYYIVYYVYIYNYNSIYQLKNKLSPGKFEIPSKEREQLIGHIWFNVLSFRFTP